MIRINLLPQNRKAQSGGGGESTQVWIAAYLLTTAALLVCFGGIYYAYEGDLDEQSRINADLSNQITAAQEQTKDIEKVRAEIARSRDLERVVADLQRARLGPTRVLLEIAKILSENGGPTIDPARLEEERSRNPLAGFNPGWDPRRLWLTTFEEENRGCKMAGLGKTNEDVAEFLRRLSLSDSFEMVQLEKTEALENAESATPLVRFELSCKVRY